MSRLGNLPTSFTRHRGACSILGARSSSRGFATLRDLLTLSLSQVIWQPAGYMTMSGSPIKLFLLSLGLLSAGLALAFLMTIQLLKPSFVLGFLAYAASLAGLVLGVCCAIQHGRFWRRGPP